LGDSRREDEVDPLLVLVVVDALGYEIARAHRFGEGILGPIRPLETVLGYSSAAIPTLLTGRLPCETGLWAMHRYDPEGSPFKSARLLRFAPARFHPRIRRWFKRRLASSGRMEGYFELYEIPLRFLHLFAPACPWDPYRPGFPPARTIFDELRSRGLRWRCWDYRGCEEDNFRALLRSCRGEERLLFLYTPRLDSLMHDEGTRSPRVGERLARLERWLRRIAEQGARARREVLLVVVSDHGMNDVTAVLDLRGELARRGLELGRDYLAFYDATMGRFWPRSGREGDLEDALADGLAGRVVPEEELRTLGCYFPDGSYGEVLFLADPGVMIVPSFVSLRPLAAMHGYHPSDGDTKAMVAANFDLGEGLVSIADVKGKILEVLGIGD